MNYQSFIQSVLEDASIIADAKFGNVSGFIKEHDPNQVLTEADLAIGKLIVEKIKRDYPEYNVIDEEAGVIDNGSQFTWVVDPIDGTSNFASGVPTYGIMLGLLDGNTPIAGGIALPYFKEITIAEKGQGAFCNGKKISVSREINLRDSLIAYGIDGHHEDPIGTKKEVEIVGNLVLAIRNLRSSNSAFDIIMVAKGGYGGALNKNSKIWDNIAPQIIVEEAGGLYTDYYGKLLDYSNPLKRTQEYFTYCTASPELHKQLQDIIHGA
ncbi:MAG TPA: inositol monophosphatase [Candidatus Acidoferrales bacterium]|nr:inositol monophosphatase [Candidatus Acidoferrales bacterium]